MSTEIPFHLQYRAPTTPQSFLGVHSKYMQRPSFIPQPVAVDIPKRFVNEQFVGVQSRYRSPKDGKLLPETPLLPKDQSVLQTKELKAHKSTATVLGFGQVPSRYFEVHTTTVTDGRRSPRKAAEEKIKQQHGEVDRDGKIFHVSRSNAPTFDDMKRKGDVKLLPHKHNTASSVVLQWIKSGISIPGMEEREVKSKSPSRVGRPFACGGGAGGGSYERRPTSPIKKAAEDECRTVQRMCDAMCNTRRTSPPRVASLHHPRFQREAFNKSPQSMPSMLRQYQAVEVSQTPRRTVQQLLVASDSPSPSLFCKRPTTDPVQFAQVSSPPFIERRTAHVR